MPSTAPATSFRPGPVARVRSWLGDWLVVAAWLALLTLLGVAVRPLLDLGGLLGSAVPPAPRDVVVADIVITVLTVLPYIAYLSVSESSPRRATVGKRWAGLVVVGGSGGSAPKGAVWLRNVVKALPWQLAHLGVSRAILDVQLPLAFLLTLLALGLAAACAVPALIGRRGLHDRLAGTRVQPGAPTDAVGAGS
jgi:uncharacterized RDD family membrane protein YckC